MEAPVESRGKGLLRLEAFASRLYKLLLGCTKALLYWLYT